MLCYVAAMNDATLEFIAQMKAKRAALEQAKAEKQRRKEEAKQRIKQHAKRRSIETEQRIREQNEQEFVAVSEVPCKRVVNLTPEQVAQIGERIPGSSLFRDFCVVCGEAIRVVHAGTRNTCLDCEPTGKPGSVDKTLVKNSIQYHGGRFHSAEW